MILGRHHPLISCHCPLNQSIGLFNSRSYLALLIIPISGRLGLWYSGPFGWKSHSSDPYLLTITCAHECTFIACWVHNLWVTGCNSLCLRKGSNLVRTFFKCNLYFVYLITTFCQTRNDWRLNMNGSRNQHTELTLSMAVPIQILASWLRRTVNQITILIKIVERYYCTVLWWTWMC